MPDDDAKAQIERIDRLIATAKGSWFALLSYLAFIGVTLMGVEDADFFIPSRQIELPIIGVSVPTALFFYGAPGLGAAVYAYFHLHLLKLWEQLSKASAQVDNTPLSDHIAPWLIADYALAQRTDGALRKRPLGRLAHYVIGGLVFWTAPLMLAAFWFRSMPKHDPWLTGLAIGVPLLVAIYVGKRSHEQLVTLMKPAESISTVGKTALGFVAAVILIFGQLASYGIYDEDPRMQALNDWAEWPVSANLAGVAFAQTPADWESHEVARNSYRRDWCKIQGIPALACGDVNYAGPVLTDDLVHVRKEWCRKTLVEGRVCADYFEDLDHRFASDWSKTLSAEIGRLTPLDLSEQDMRRANLADARLQWANLSNANLQGAILFRTRLEGANLRNAQLNGANLISAQLNEANLSYAQLRDSAFFAAQLDGANLTGTQLDRSSFRVDRVAVPDVLSATSIRGAAIRDADHSDVQWKQSHIDVMFGDASVALSATLSRPAHWPNWRLGDIAFEKEWRKWQADPASYIPPEKPS